MRILLTGTTGFIGGAALDAAIAGPWLHRLLPHFVIRIDELARALVELTATRTPRTVSNAEARAIGEMSRGLLNDRGS